MIRAAFFMLVGWLAGMVFAGHIINANVARDCPLPMTVQDYNACVVAVLEGVSHE